MAVFIIPIVESSRLKKKKKISTVASIVKTEIPLTE